MHPVFYYGAHDPASAVAGFDTAILEAGHGTDLLAHKPRGARWLAYLSVGEVLASRPHFARLPAAWRCGYNPAWQSHLIDQGADGWPAFFARELARPLWQRGFDGFFLDTLDSWRLARQDAAWATRQQQGLIRVLHQLRATLPRAIVVVNRGFEVLDAVHAQIDAVAFESLYAGWNPVTGRYTAVPAADRRWLLLQAERVRAHGLAAIALDYCPAEQPAIAQRLLRRIRAYGLLASVADAHLQRVNPALRRAAVAAQAHAPAADRAAQSATMRST